MSKLIMQALLEEQEARRKARARRMFWLVAVPLAAAAFWLGWRL